jgi:hypothetical protein
MGKFKRPQTRGAAVRISDLKRELKQTYGLSQQEVQANLTYLMSQGWVEEDVVKKVFVAPKGTVIPSETNYYRITAAGIDKIEGAGEFTMPKFAGIQIEATGQNIITLGDGNQINTQFGELAVALVELRKEVLRASVPEAEKLNAVADIVTIASQLAKPAPNKHIIRAAWETVAGAAAVGGAIDLVSRVATLIGRVVA